MAEKYLQLQPRLQLLADLVPQGARLADIGTDHGYLPVWLLQRNKIAAAIAADIGEEPLQHARRTAEEYGVDGIEFRLCDGLKDIQSREVDTYCRFPNPALDGKTCQKEAPRLHNHEYNLLSALRNKHRERYKKWVHSITDGKREYQEPMLRYILNTEQFGPTRAARKKYYQSLLETINTNYINWCNDTKVALEEFKREKLTKSECEAKIKCPPVKKRCKEFYAVLHAAKVSQETEH